jgi:hypothetical protein
VLSNWQGDFIESRSELVRFSEECSQLLSVPVFLFLGPLSSITSITPFVPKVSDCGKTAHCRCDAENPSQYSSILSTKT